MAAFLHPWALGVGAAAAALPVAIHFLTRPRPVRLPFSTVRFVQAALKQQQARHRLRDFIVLSLRTLAVFLIGCAFARPLIGDRQAVAADEPGQVARVVILDTSVSMAAQHGGVQLFERARTVAANLLGDQTDRRANVIFAGANARASFPRLTPNAAALREDLSNTKVRPEKLNVAAALQTAGELLATAGPDIRQELIIVSDFQRANWAAADFAPLPTGAKVQLESVAPSEPLANLAVLRAAAPGRAELGRDLRVEVEVGNFSPTPRQVRIEVALADATTTIEGLCPAAGRITLTADVPIRASGWMTGAARLLDVRDALPDDDARPFVVEVRSPPTYALVTRQAAELRNTSSYYLERALVPLAPRPGRTDNKVVRVDPARLDREIAADAELIVIDHPGRMTPEAVRTIASLLRRGRGVLYVTGESMDATNLKLLADAAGSDWQLPVEFVPPAAGERRRNLFFTGLRNDRAPWTVFGDGLLAITGPLRINGGLGSRQREGALADDVLATLNDRSAGLVASACGSGMVAILNADLASSNLVSSPAFVPLIGELTSLLLGRGRMTDAAKCGEPLVALLPAAAGSAVGLRVIGPDNAETGTISDESGGALWRCGNVTKPGVYLVKRGDVPVFAVAAGLPNEESDLRTLEPAVFTERLAGGRAVSFRSAVADEGEEQDRLWAWLAVACIGCLLGEIVALKVFRT